MATRFLRSLFLSCLVPLSLIALASCGIGGGEKECKAACENCLGETTGAPSTRSKHDERSVPACVKTCKRHGTTAVFAYCAANKPTQSQCVHACAHYSDVIKARQQRKGTVDDLVFGNTYGDKKKCVRTCKKYGTQEMLRCVYRSQIPTQAQRCMR